MFNYYKAETKELDFRNPIIAAKAINDWVKFRTKENIKEIVSSDELNMNTQLILVNAIYFKGFWKSPFDKICTKQETFRMTDGKTKVVKMMNTLHVMHYARLEEIQSFVVELPYGHGRFVMYVIVPDRGCGLNKVEQSFENFDLLDEFKTKSETAWLDFSLPRFSIKIDIDAYFSSFYIF